MFTGDTKRNSGKDVIRQTERTRVGGKRGRSAPVRHTDGGVISWYLSGDDDVRDLLAAVFQVFGDYVDDCRNTDNAWVEVVVLNIHIKRANQVLVDVNNVVRAPIHTQQDHCFGVICSDRGLPDRS